MMTKSLFLGPAPCPSPHPGSVSASTWSHRLRPPTSSSSRDAAGYSEVQAPSWGFCWGGVGVNMGSLVVNGVTVVSIGVILGSIKVTWGQWDSWGHLGVTVGSCRVMRIGVDMGIKWGQG